jgi:hypothetical protein
MAGVLSAAVTTTTLPHAVPVPTIPGQLAPGAGSIVVHGGGSSTVFSQSSGLGFGLGLFSTFLSLLSIMAIFAVLGAFVIIVVANRADPDPTGTRATTVYAFAVSFITIIAVLFASTVMVGALITLITPHRVPVADDVARALVLGGLVTLVTGSIHLAHRRRGVSLATASGEATSPSRRVGQSYVAVVSFVMVLFLIVVIVLASYMVFVLIGPGVFGSFGSRGAGVRMLVVALYVALASWRILARHRHLLPAPGSPTTT